MRFLLVLTLFSLTSCYRFPEGDECSLVPMTNNPDVTRERSDSGAMPNVGF